DVQPFVLAMRAGHYTFTDSDGDKVRINYWGSGQVTITFTGAEADGSDIASIEVQGVRQGGLSVRTTGDADVGSVEIHGWQRNGRVRGKLGTFRVDGDVGTLSSDV